MIDRIGSILSVLLIPESYLFTHLTVVNEEVISLTTYGVNKIESVRWVLG